MDDAVPAHELLDTSYNKDKAELASKGGLANRKSPSVTKGPSFSSSVSETKVIRCTNKCKESR